jgi:uncharacterized MAPEG superfamily protein
MEQYFAAFPFKLNAVTSVAMVLGLAYLPVIEKVILVRTASKFKGTVDEVQNSRFLSNSILSDNSPNGLRMSRLVGCHTNGLEAFTYYAAAILLALVCKVPKDVTDGAAGAFVACRTLYTAVYISPLNGSLRTLTFALGLVCCVSLMMFAASRYE